MNSTFRACWLALSLANAIHHKSGTFRVLRTLTKHSAEPREPLFYSNYIFTSSEIFYCTDPPQHRIDLLNIYRMKKKPASIGILKYLNGCLKFFIRTLPHEKCPPFSAVDPHDDLSLLKKMGAITKPQNVHLY